MDCGEDMHSFYGSYIEHMVIQTVPILADESVFYRSGMVFQLRARLSLLKVLCTVDIVLCRLIQLFAGNQENLVQNI